MKKSVVIYFHIAFWIALLSSVVINRIKFFVGFPTIEFSIISEYVYFLRPFFFYLGYLVIMRIKWNRNLLLTSILGIISIYFIPLFISVNVFLWAIAPISTLFIWAITGCLFRILIDWVKKKNDLIILEKENAESNLALLKNQINPHFLFNTLHNIDTLIYDNQDKASKSLVKLSDIMRYMLKDAKSDYVEMQQEIEHLENYLALEQLRLKNEKFLNYTIEGDYTGITIAPMIMIPFVENAFKHSVDSSIENGIVIRITIENRTLSFVCENQFDKFDIDKDIVHGIGLETVKKRLDLIYKNRYKLSINSVHSVYKVNLEIDLNDN